MNHPAHPLARLWHQLRARPRLASSILLSACLFAGLPHSLDLTTRALVTWDVGAGLYLMLGWIMMNRSSEEHLRWRARIQDDGAAAILFLTVAAAIASLAAIILELSDLKSLSPMQRGQHVALVALTFATSWLIVHTAFALHYAHVYYVAGTRNGEAVLMFPQQEKPVYLDFLYFSMVIGMTSQTADVAIADTRMRRLVMTHGIVAFVFNTTLLALAINIAGGLLG